MLRPLLSLGLVPLRCFVPAWLAIALAASCRASGQVRYRVDCRPRLLKEAAMYLRALGLAGVAAVLFAVPALAPHSFSVFDHNKLNTIMGTAKLFELQNPHAWRPTEFTDANGQAALLSFRGGSPSQ